MSGDPVRVLVADDDPDYRLLVRLALEDAEDLDLVGEAATAAALVARAGLGVDLVLLDRSLPGAASALARLRADQPEVRVVLTSSLPLNRVAADVAAVEAVGSLAKDVPVRRLPAAIRDLAGLVAAAERALHTVRHSLPHALASVPMSRQVARSLLEPWVSDEVRETAILLMSELVTNAVRHAGSEVGIRVAVGADRVRIEVVDRNPALPVRRSPAPTELGGRGMALVDELSLQWGVVPRRTGKVIWFELPRAAAASTGRA